MPNEEGTFERPDGTVRVRYRTVVTTGDRMDMDLADWAEVQDGRQVFKRADLARFLFTRFCTALEVKDSAGTWVRQPFSLEALRALPEDGSGLAARLSDHLVAMVGREEVRTSNLGKESSPPSKPPTVVPAPATT